MTTSDPVLGRLAEGVRLREQGRHAEARFVMEQLWTDIGGDTGDPLHRCTVAHSLADAQDDVLDELRWDLAALDAALEVTDDHVAATASAPSGPPRRCPTASTATGSAPASPTSPDVSDPDIECQPSGAAT